MASSAHLNRAFLRGTPVLVAGEHRFERMAGRVDLGIGPPGSIDAAELQEFVGIGETTADAVAVRRKPQEDDHRKTELVFRFDRGAARALLVFAPVLGYALVNADGEVLVLSRGRWFWSAGNGKLLWESYLDLDECVAQWLGRPAKRGRFGRGPGE